MKVFFDSIGCRLNQSEIEKFASQFRAAGHEVVASAAEADLVVINTCSVTVEAASDSRQKIRQAARAGAGQIVLTGCWSTLEPQAAAELPGVGRLIPNSEKDDLASAVLGVETFDLEPLARQPLPGVHQRTRAFLKVQDGCDNLCTYCVTRLARGAGRSVSVEQVLDDARFAVAGGARELVLTGVHLGSWGREMNPPARLQDLIAALLAWGGMQRLRLSSLEPWEIDPELIELWRDPRLCRHLHLPLQSGSQSVLRRMLRKTELPEFARLIQQFRAAAPGMAITTDLIAGFPGETEEEFQAGLDFVRRMDFAGGHVFPYSARPGTSAARMTGQVPHPLRRQRAAALRAVLAESSRRFHRAFLGSCQQVLWESAEALDGGAWRMHGLTDNYLRVSALAGENRWNQIDPVRLNRLEDDEFAGEINS